jgi:hypothetical protein
LNKIKGKYGQIDFDFEEKEQKLRVQIWKIEVEILKTAYETECDEPIYKIDVDEFSVLDMDFSKLKIKKNFSEFKGSEWFTLFKDKINEILPKFRKLKNDE